MTTPSRPRRVPNLALGRNSEQKKSDFPIWPAALESPGELWSPPVADICYRPYFWTQKVSGAAR